MDRDEICARFLEAVEFELYAYQEEALLAWFEEKDGVLRAVNLTHVSERWPDFRDWVVSESGYGWTGEEVRGRAEGVQAQTFELYTCSRAVVLHHLVDAVSGDRLLQIACPPVAHVAKSCIKNPEPINANPTRDLLP